MYICIHVYIGGQSISQLLTISMKILLSLLCLYVRDMGRASQRSQFAHVTMGRVDVNIMEVGAQHPKMQRGLRSCSPPEKSKLFY